MSVDAGGGWTQGPVKREDLTVIAQSSAGFFPGRLADFLSIRGAKMTKGHLSVVAYEGDVALMFETLEAGITHVIPQQDLLRVGKVKGGLNTIVDVVGHTPDHDGDWTLCFVGPRGRMRKIFAGVGHPLT